MAEELPDHGGRIEESRTYIAEGGRLRPVPPRRPHARCRDVLGYDKNRVNKLVKLGAVASTE